jgi:transmembrane sensor
MPKATSALSAALRRIDDHWDERRTERTLGGVHRKQRRRSWQRRGAAAAALVVLALAAQRVWVGEQRAPVVARAPAAKGGGSPEASADAASASARPSSATAAEALGASADAARTSARSSNATAAEASARARAPGDEAPASFAATPSRLHMQLEDGSEISLHDEHTQLTVAEVTHRRALLDMRAGRARFDVVHRVERAFVVRCGEVTIEVLGTAFELERDGARTHVAVLRGRVAVSWSTGRTELTAGDAAWFPRGEPSLPPARRARGAIEPAARSSEPAQRGRSAIEPAARSSEPSQRGRGAIEPAARSSAPAPNTWREPAERGEFDRAYELLRRDPQAVADDVAQLLLAADTARLSGHPDAALPFLRRVVAQHAADSRAPLAAFTLGGVLMQQLGQPREAEAAYARARELASTSPLAEDALARQVEAAHRAGDAARARTLGQEYLAKYPRGRRVHAVQRFAGL